MDYKRKSETCDTTSNKHPKIESDYESINMDNSTNSTHSTHPTNLTQPIITINRDIIRNFLNNAYYGDDKRLFTIPHISGTIYIGEHPL